MSNFIVKLPTVEFQSELFENMIKERGVQISWEKAAMCPCVRADATTGRPTFNCGECYNGNLYIDRVELLGAVTNITGQRNAQVFGDLALGGLFLTVPGAYRLGVQDRITLLGQTARYNELGTVGVTTVREAAAVGATSIVVEHTRKFPTPKVGWVQVSVGGQTIRYTGKTASSLTGVPASGVGAITAPIAPNTPLSMAEYMLRYEPIEVFDLRKREGDNAVSEKLVGRQDYEIVDKRRIRFMPGQTVENFTVMYESRPVYLVDSLSHEFRDQIARQAVRTPTLQRLPVAAVLRKDVLNRVG